MSKTDITTNNCDNIQYKLFWHVIIIVLET